MLGANKLFGFHTVPGRYRDEADRMSSIGSSMLIVDAISEQAAAFYEANGFVRLPNSLRLILPMQAIAKLVES